MAGIIHALGCVPMSSGSAAARLLPNPTKPRSSRSDTARSTTIAPRYTHTPMHTAVASSQRRPPTDIEVSKAAMSADAPSDLAKKTKSKGNLMLFEPIPALTPNCTANPKRVLIAAPRIPHLGISMKLAATFTAIAVRMLIVDHACLPASPRLTSK